jgi:hypothetical protein
MANQYLIAAAAPARAITAKLYDEDVVLVDTAIDVSETVANTGAYTITFTNATELSGSYRLIMIDDVTGYGIAQYNAVLTGTTSEVVQAYEYTASGSGAATEAKQDQILAAISPITTVYTPQLTEDTLTLVRGDAYDGVANNGLSWTSSKDVSGYPVNFTIRDSQDVIVMDTSTAGVDTGGSIGNTLSVTLSSAATDLLDPLKSIYTFDVEVEFSATSRWTAVKGTLCVEQDVSRD